MSHTEHGITGIYARIDNQVVRSAIEKAVKTMLVKGKLKLNR